MDKWLGVSAGNAEIDSQGTDNPIVKKIKRLHGKKFLVRRGIKDHIRDTDGTILIYKTERALRRTMLAEILMVGSACEIIMQGDVGAFVHCAVWGPKMTPLGDDYWILDEKLIEDGNKTTCIKPFVVTTE